VQKEYGSYKRVKYNGERINVRFEIGFVAHDEGADLSKYSGANGQNRLLTEAITKQDVLEESNSQEVSVDVAGINGKKSVLTAPDGSELSLTPKDKRLKQISTIAHGIGHNIGLEHADGGVMEDQNSTIYVEDGYAGKKIYTPSFTPNKVTKSNVGNLINKIDDMQTKGHEYWKGKKGEQGNGITTIKK
jgi:hypothetical protein